MIVCSRQNDRIVKIDNISEVSMKKLFALSTLALGVLAGCGGGGGGGAGALPTLSGVAATGAAVAAATVKIYDATGTEVGSGTTDANGEFSIQLTALGTAPYILKLTKDEIVLHAMQGSAKSEVVNITPLSDAVTALASPTGTSDNLVDALKAGATAPSAATIEDKQAVVTAAMAPLKTATATATDIFKEKFNPNGAGLDQMLDSIALTKTADKTGESTGTANVQVAIKLATDPENPAETPPSLNLTSTTTVQQARTEAGSVGPITTADLTPRYAAKLYSDLVENLNKCYQDSPATRTDGNTVVTSDACKKVFFNNNPALYKNYGQGLGRNAQFAGLFTYPGEVVFKPLEKAYLVQDLEGVKSLDGKGRAIVAMSWVNENGNRENIMLYTTKYTLNGTELLGISGDRNDYGWSVNSHNQKREFPLRPTSDLDYVTGAYLISVRDVIENGSSVISYATVITPPSAAAPNGKKIILASVKGGASRDLAICKSSEVVKVNNIPTRPSLTDSGKYYCTGTSKALTMSERFVSDSETRKPSQMTNAGILRPLDASGSPYTPTSDELKKYANIGMWKIEYTFTDGRAVKTQKTWSVARPLTTEELMGPTGPDAVLPKYTASTINAMKALKVSQVANLTGCPSVLPAGTDCDPTQSPIPAPSSGGFTFLWTANSKVPVTSLWASGSKNDANTSFIYSVGSTPWDDQLLVRSTATIGEVKCSRQSLTDEHCNGTGAAGSIADYNVKTWMSYSELWGKDAEQRSMMRSYNWYQPKNGTAAF